MNEGTPVLFCHCCDAKIKIKRKNDLKIFIISKKNYVEKIIDIILVNLVKLRGLVVFLRTKVLGTKN